MAPEKPKIKNFEFLPSSVKNHFETYILWAVFSLVNRFVWKIEHGFFAMCYIGILGNILRARKHRFTLCFRALSNQYVERSAYTNVFKFNREIKRCDRAKVNSRCFFWFAAAMLESLRRAQTWRVHTKHYNFQ